LYVWSDFKAQKFELLTDPFSFIFERGQNNFIMKLKTRIKRALAGFLREELLEYIGYNHKIPYMSLNDRFNVENLPFETMVMEVEIPIEMDGRMGYKDPTRLEKHIEECKRRFADQIMEHIHVDAQNLTTREHFMRRSVKFVLRVQGKK